MKKVAIVIGKFLVRVLLSMRSMVNWTRREDTRTGAFTREDQRFHLWWVPSRLRRWKYVDYDLCSFCVHHTRGLFFSPTISRAHPDAPCTYTAILEASHEASDCGTAGRVGRSHQQA